MLEVIHVIVTSAVGVLTVINVILHNKNSRALLAIGEKMASIHSHHQPSQPIEPKKDLTTNEGITELVKDLKASESKEENRHEKHKHKKHKH